MFAKAKLGISNFFKKEDVIRNRNDLLNNHTAKN